MLKGYIQFPPFPIPVTFIPSTPFDPGTLSGNTLWLDANNAGSITQSGGYVSQWNDLSPTGATFTQANAALQPLYVSNAINGKPALSFDQSTDGTHGALVDTGTNQFVGDGTTPFTIWAVVQPGTVATFIVFADFHGTGTEDNPEFGFAASDASYKYVYFISKGTGPFTAVRSETAFSDPNTTYMITITNDGAANYAFFNSNVAQTVVSSGEGPINNANTRIGGSVFGAADPTHLFAEMAIYNRVLNSTELAQLQAYGNSKYGL